MIGDESITAKGEEFYISCLENKSFDNQAVAKKEIEEAFDLWWGTRDKEGIYPSSNYFEHKNKTFKGTQKKTVRKEQTKINFKKLVLSGAYTVSDILEGTKNHILTAKDNSVKKGDNQLSYIPNSERYLREESFAPFITKVQKKTADEFGGTTI